MTIRFVLGLLFGVMLGASLALAFGPKSAADTRLWEQIQQRAQPEEA